MRGLNESFLILVLVVDPSHLCSNSNAVTNIFGPDEAVIIDDLKLTEIKTKAVADVLKILQIADKTCLIGLGKSDIDANQTYTGQIYEERGRGFLALRGMFSYIPDGKKAGSVSSLVRNSG